MNRKLSFGWELVVACTAVISSWVAFKVEIAGGLVVVFLISMFALSFSRTPRRAFYWGLLIGTLTSAIHLHFFTGLFGLGAVPLWAILGLWTGLFSWVSRKSRDIWKTHAVLLIPFFWVGFEYFRSELYPLKFSWLAPGMALNHPLWLNLASLGYYGFSFMILTLCSVFCYGGLKRWRVKGVALLACALAITLVSWSTNDGKQSGPYVAGIQFEFAQEDQILSGLDKVLRLHPNTDVVVLSEYSFGGRIPADVQKWCQTNKRYLVAGGKETTGPGPNDFRNTIFVLSPQGDVIHTQVKSVPIQFFQDGVAATEQTLWQSPWGPIGIAVCYDLSYTRVMDRLVAMGAEGLIIPTMDVSDWGEAEHELHAKIPFIRAKEYRIPIFRVASSGISQLVDAGGKQLASAPFPGPTRVLGGRMELSPKAHVPVLRYLCLPAVFITVLTIMYICMSWLKRRMPANTPTAKRDT